MGEAGRKNKKRAEFLSEHKWCIYCGAPADTTDHCPPRCFFIGRQWPETYEFPACTACNAEARLDEQALAVLNRSELTDFKTQSARAEWERLVRGVRNNQPAILAEWTSTSAVERKRIFRERFGRDGDQMRFEGWGAVTLGPLTQGVIERFMIKLTRALYYRHNNQLFEGVLFARHINMISEKEPDALMASILDKAPEISKALRNRLPLDDQFAYRFNYSPEHGVLYAVVRLNPQFVLQLIALSFEMAAMLETDAPPIRPEHQAKIRFECRLKQRPPVS